MAKASRSDAGQIDIFRLTEKAKDQPTADLLTQRLYVHEKTARMLRSLLEEQD